MKLWLLKYKEAITRDRRSEEAFVIIAPTKAKAIKIANSNTSKTIKKEYFNMSAKALKNIGLSIKPEKLISAVEIKLIKSKIVYKGYYCC